MKRPAARVSPVEPERSAALLGQRVAFTGRFATLTRVEAERLVMRAAGRPVSGSTPSTIVVVGMRGWPLMESGRTTRTLEDAERARASGKPVRIVSETQFREMVGLEEPPPGASKSLSAEQVCAALGIDRRALERWEHCGLVRSIEGRFDFQDLVSLRTVTGLVARGVSPVVIRRSLDALGALLPGVDRPLAQLNILVSASGHLVAELEEALLTQSGQLELRFDTPAASGEPSAPLSFALQDARDSAAWVDAGLEHEEAGDLEKSEHAYRRAAALAPNDATPQFNLGNILRDAGKLQAAAERYARAVALDPSHARAWFNLAHIEDALKRPQEALKHLRRAVAADPAYADAHYNLAEIAERLGDDDTAARAWSEYLRLDPASEWGEEAHRRLASHRRPAWV
jgi:tetratricopeptide (TPR) repeat protein